MRLVSNTTHGRCSHGRRLLRRAAASAAIAALGGTLFLIASAHAEDVAKPAEALANIQNIQRHILEIYENLELTTERLQLLELELAVVQRRCAGAEPRPPVWSEPEH